MLQLIEQSGQKYRVGAVTAVPFGKGEVAAEFGNGIEGKNHLLLVSMPSKLS